MNKLLYPAIFEKEDTRYSIFFPNIPGCNSEGDTVEEAYEMAKDALGLMYTTYKENMYQAFPAPCDPTEIHLEESQSLVMVEFDRLEYRRKYESKAVKKTLMIPSWFNDMASSANAAFSKVQEALKQQLHLNIPVTQLFRQKFNDKH